MMKSYFMLTTDIGQRDIGPQSSTGMNDISVPDEKQAKSTTSRSSSWGWLVLIGLLTVGCLCMGSLWTVNWYATAGPGAGLSSTLCAGIATTPRTQIGMSWQSPLSSYLSPLTYSPLALCMHLPYTWLAPYQPHSWVWLWPP